MPDMDLLVRFVRVRCVLRHSLGFKGVSLEFSGDFCDDCCLGRRSVVAASGGMIGFSFRLISDFVAF